jgi:hypothetical protein
MVLHGDSLVTAGSELFSATDFDGDGSLSNYSLLAINAQTGAVSYLGLSDFPLEVERDLPVVIGDSMFLMVNAQLYRLDLSTNSLTLIPPPLLGPPTDAGEGLLAMGVLEQPGMDLNNDGDVADSVLHLVDPVTLDLVTNLGVSGATGAKTAEGGGVLLTTISESHQASRDRNDDGDTGDLTLLAHDLRSGRELEFKLAVTLPFSEFLPTHFTTNGKLIAFTVSESGQAATDLNHDGDLSDRILHVYDIRRGVLHNLQTAVRGTRIVNRSVIFTVNEVEQGGLDLDGDGDSLDAIVHIVDF